MELVSSHRCFGGEQRFYRHDSTAIGLPMRFSVFVPVKPSGAALFYLAGLTCTEETFAIKGGAQRRAAELGLTLIAPDTSPRGANVPGEADAWDFGVGAGFYLDATQAPWQQHWRMETYITDELYALAVREFKLNAARIGIFGHSMGGHGALTLALRHREKFSSVSAFAPIAAPQACAWGKKAFTGYLGEDQAAWARHDAASLMSATAGVPFPQGILIDQGEADKFLHDGQLLPEKFEAACADVDQPLTLRSHPGYDHGYYFISTFMDDHLGFHAERLV